MIGFLAFFLMTLIVGAPFVLVSWITDRLSAEVLEEAEVEA